MCAAATPTIATLDCIHSAFFIAWVFAMNRWSPERTLPAGPGERVGGVMRVLRRFVRMPLPL
jgi:hypothetical protein